MKGIVAIKVRLLASLWKLRIKARRRKELGEVNIVPRYKVYSSISVILRLILRTREISQISGKQNSKY